jgi:hypothetical protein
MSKKMQTMREMIIDTTITIAKLMMWSNTQELGNMTRMKKNIQNLTKSSITINKYSTLLI